MGEKKIRRKGTEKIGKVTERVRAVHKLKSVVLGAFLLISHSRRSIPWS
jgi:hypothetical protein